MKYRLKADRFEHLKDTIVYTCNKYDYGLAFDDELITGIPHQSVTLREDGDYPSFTVPCVDLEKIS